MQNIFIDFLPPWVETGLQPAFYDAESGTVLQQTSRMYAKVNELIGSVNNQNSVIADYIEQFNALKDYVDDYFDNLDVQTEINHKLDEMTADGSLTTLISSYVDTVLNPVINTINHQIDNQNASITTLTDRVDGVASGSPAGVYATASALSTADPDHSKIYVVEADGKWYFYDTTTSAWKAGGTYQSTVNSEVVDARQAYSSLKARLNDELSVNDSLLKLDSYTFTSNFTAGGITNSGDFTTTATRARNAYNYFYNNTEISLTDKDYQFNLFEYNRTTLSFIQKITPDWVSSWVLTAPEGRTTTNAICIVVKDKDGSTLSSDETLAYIKTIFNITPLDLIDKTTNARLINNTTLENTYVDPSDMSTSTNQKYGLFNVYRLSTPYMRLKAYPNYKFKVIRSNEKGRFIEYINEDWVYDYEFTSKMYFRVISTKVNEDDVNTTTDRCVYVDGSLESTSIDDMGVLNEFEPFETDYSCPADNPKENSITMSQFINTFYTPLLGARDNGIFVGRKILGRDQSDTYNIYEFEFKPKNNKYKHTILLSSGMHGYELPAPFGVAMWIDSYMNSNDPQFKWLRENVRVKVIPIVNPYGFNHTPNKRYGNVNGVNINRNFNDIYDTWYSFPNFAPNPDGEHEDGTIDPVTGLPYNEFSYKGTAPYSESETRILRDWCYDNSDAKFWIDCHTGITNDNGEIWAIYFTANANRYKLGRANHVLENYYYDTYGEVARKHIELNSTASIKNSFATRTAGIPSMTLEQSGLGNMYGGNANNNSSQKIVNYALQLNTYILSQLKD